VLDHDRYLLSIRFELIPCGHLPHFQLRNRTIDVCGSPLPGIKTPSSDRGPFPRSQKALSLTVRSSVRSGFDDLARRPECFCSLRSGCLIRSEAISPHLLNREYEAAGGDIAGCLFSRHALCLSCIQVGRQRQSTADGESLRIIGPTAPRCPPNPSHSLP